MGSIHCNARSCAPKPTEPSTNPFVIDDLKPDLDILLQNEKLKLLFDKQTGLLKTALMGWRYREMRNISINFGAYMSELGSSGAYLFKPDGIVPDQILSGHSTSSPSVIVVTGPVASEVIVCYYPLLLHTVRIFHSQTELDEMVSIVNDVDLQKYQNREFYMRLVTDVENGISPRFFTDANGFQYQMRQTVDQLGVEANYYPITSGMFIQDDTTRVTLLTDHSVGGTSFKQGQLEVMLDRRTELDDSRGMSEPVQDNVRVRHRFWLMVEGFTMKPAKEGENFPETYKPDPNEVQTLSWQAHQRANSLIYPLNVYAIVEGRKEEKKSEWRKAPIKLLNGEFPCDIHLVTARTMSDANNFRIPSKDALLVLMNQPYSCSLTRTVRCAAKEGSGKDGTLFTAVQIKSMKLASLSGVEDQRDWDNIFNPEIPPNEIKSFKIAFGGKAE